MAGPRTFPSLVNELGVDEIGLRPLAARMGLGSWLRLHAAAIEATSDPGLPARAAARMQPDAFPIPLHLLGSQTTVREGRRFSAPYLSVGIEGLCAELIPSKVRSRFDFTVDGAPLRPGALAEFFMIGLFAFGKRVIPSELLPDRINFAHRKPSHADALCGFVPCPVRFGGRSVGFEFPTEWLELPIRGADPQLGQLLATQAVEWLSTPTRTARLADRVRLWLARNLRDTDAIAYELGFSSVGAFCRAFKRWTGSSPTTYKAGL